MKDRNNVQVYTVPSAALAGGDITLASGETLEAQSGSTIDMKDGSTLNLGDGTGGGANVVVAATTRVTGNWVPAVTGGALGSITNLWDAFIRALKVTSSILPLTAAQSVIGLTSLPFLSIVSRAISARTVSVYDQTQPAATADLVKLNQLMLPLACCCQTSSTSTPLVDSAKNIASVNRTAPGVYTVTFSVGLGGTGVKVGVVSGNNGAIIANVSCGITTATVRTYTDAGAPVDAVWQLVVFGNPGVADPIS